LVTVGDSDVDDLGVAECDALTVFDRLLVMLTVADASVGDRIHVLDGVTLVVVEPLTHADGEGDPDDESEPVDDVESDGVPDAASDADAVGVERADADEAVASGDDEKEGLPVAESDAVGETESEDVTEAVVEGVTDTDAVVDAHVDVEAEALFVGTGALV